MRRADDVTTSRRGFGIRLLAGGLDAVLGTVVALLLAGTLGRWFAGRAVVMLSIGSPDTFWRGPIPMVLGILGSFVYGLPFALLLVLLAEALFGASPGKWLLGLQVVAADGTSAPTGSRLLRWAAKCSGLWAMVLALVAGSWPVAIAALTAALIASAGFCLSIGPRSLALHDRLFGTAVHSCLGRDAADHVQRSLR